MNRPKNPVLNPTKISAIFQSMRPPFLILSPLCILLGVVLSKKLTGNIDVSSILISLLAALAAHVSVNTFNEYFDFSSGLDLITNRSLYNGGSGSLINCPKALLSVLCTAIAFLLLTIIFGIYLTLIKNIFLLPLGILGIGLILTYTQHINKFPWLCLFSPGLAFGPIIILGAFLCAIPNTHSVNDEEFILVFISSLVPFFLTNNLLLLNQIPDIEADQTVGRNTFPIRYGIAYSISIYLISSAFASSMMLYCYSLLNTTILIYLSAFIPLFASLYIGLGIYDKSKTGQQGNLTSFLAHNVAVTLISILMFSLVILFC